MRDAHGLQGDSRRRALAGLPEITDVLLHGLPAQVCLAGYAPASALEVTR
jgi:hypothetical protein